MMNSGCTLLNARRWYEMGNDEINFIIDEYGKVSKIRASSILEVDLQQADELMNIKDKGDVEAYKKFVADLRAIRQTAVSKFTTKAVIMGVGGGTLLGVHNVLCDLFGLKEKTL